MQNTIFSYGNLKDYTESNSLPMKDIKIENYSNFVKSEPIKIIQNYTTPLYDMNDNIKIIQNHTAPLDDMNDNNESNLKQINNSTVSSLENVNKKDFIAPNVYLTGNPQITFSKSIYRRYTDFEMKYCVVNKCKLSDNKKQYHYDIPVKNKYHLLYKIYLIPNDDISFSNIKNVRIKYGDCVLADMSGICIDNIYYHSNFINIYDTVTAGLALPIVSITFETISVDVEFHNDVNSEIILGIKYGIMHSADEVTRFMNASHEYLKRCYREDIISVNQNEKRVININRTCPIEGIKFVMIPDNSSINCSMNGCLKKINEKYPINQFQCVDIIYDQISYYGCSAKSIDTGNDISDTNTIKTPIDRFFIPKKNVYLLNFKNTGLSDHLQPAGYINFRNGNKLVFIPNFTGTIHIIYREINVLRIMNGNLGFTYDYTDSNDGTEDDNEIDDAIDSEMDDKIENEIEDNLEDNLILNSVVI